MGSEDCLNREILNNPARLGRPAVEVDVRVDCGIGGVGMCSSSSTLPLRREADVDDLPRASTVEFCPPFERGFSGLCEALEVLLEKLGVKAAIGNRLGLPLALDCSG